MVHLFKMHHKFNALQFFLRRANAISLIKYSCLEIDETRCRTLQLIYYHGREKIRFKLLSHLCRIIRIFLYQLQQSCAAWIFLFRITILSTDKGVDEKFAELQNKCSKQFHFIFSVALPHLSGSIRFNTCPTDDEIPPETKKWQHFQYGTTLCWS